MNVATSIWIWRFATPAERADSIRVAFAALNATACFPCQREAWYPDHAVATVASASSTVATDSNSRWCRSANGVAGAVARQRTGGADDLTLRREDAERPLHRRRLEASRPVAVRVVEEPEQQEHRRDHADHGADEGRLDDRP